MTNAFVDHELRPFVTDGKVGIEFIPPVPYGDLVVADEDLLHPTHFPIGSNTRHTSSVRVDFADGYNPDEHSEDDPEAPVQFLAWSLYDFGDFRGNRYETNDQRFLRHVGNIAEHIGGMVLNPEKTRV